MIKREWEQLRVSHRGDKIMVLLQHDDNKYTNENENKNEDSCEITHKK